MRTGEILTAVFWLAIALGVAWSGLDLGLGALRDPGPGFMIFWIGAAMTAVSAATLIAAVRQPAGSKLAALWEGTRWWLVPYVVVLLALYAWIMPELGFIATTTLFLLILFLTIDRHGWITPLAGAALITAAAYIVFHRWLGTQLPAGDVEHWLFTHLPAIFGRS